MTTASCTSYWPATATTSALLLIDPKRVELARYNGDPRVIYGRNVWGDDITRALEWAVGEMHGRYALMEQARQTHFGYRWPLDLIVIDELANVILADKGSEKHIVALASMSRAAGMHMLLATQRPSADIVTRLIRANVPTRCACRSSAGCSPESSSTPRGLRPSPDLGRCS